MTQKLGFFAILIKCTIILGFFFESKTILCTNTYEQLLTCFEIQEAQL